MQNVRVDLPAYQPPPAQRAAAPGSPNEVRIAPVKDTRTDAVGGMIGERTTIGNVSMGSIEMSPAPADLLAQLLKAELSQMGHRVVDSGQRYTVSALLRKFTVSTPATMVYWDINGSIEIELQVAGQGGATHAATYAATCTDRTYVYPSEELIKKVVGACVEQIGAGVRQDTRLARFIGG